MPDYFTLAELRAFSADVADVVKYPDARCNAAAAHIVAIIEREVGTSFVGRTVTDEAHDGGSPIMLRRSPVLSVTSATEGGVPVTDTLEARGGVLRRYLNNSEVSWASGINNVLVTYVTGYSLTPPADVKEMALKGTRAHLLANSDTSQMNDRRTSLNTEMGVIQYVVAGPDRPTGYPEVDAMILGWKARLDVFGFA